MTNTTVVQAWHFVGDTLLDGRPVPPDGAWLVHEGPIAICQSGLHFARDPFDALQYAPGATLCRVEVRDIVVEHTDKGAARQRRIIERRDMTIPLRQFARACALDVLPMWKAPEIVRRYLETGDESIRDAACDAASAAVCDARDAAWAAARNAARAAAWAAAWAAARNAARDAAWDAARDAAYGQYRQRFVDLVAREFGQ